MKKDRKKRKLAVIMASMDVEYAHDTLSGIMEEAYKRDYDIFVFNVYASSDETLKHNIGQYNIYSLANYSMFDAVIVFANLIQGHTAFNSVIERIRAAAVPTISIDADIEGFCHIGIDNYNSMKKIVEHLIEQHGFTKINYITGQDFNTDSQERQAAYCDALREHGIKVESGRIFPGPFSVDHGKEAALAMLESGKELPQAVACATDSIAMGVRRIFQENGIRIPEQVAISGFDNTFEARNCLPKLTTVERNQKSVGRKVVRKLDGFLNKEAELTGEAFPTTPVFAGSCGCAVKEQEKIDSIREKYLDIRDHYEKYLYESNMMIEDLNDSKTFRDFLERVKRYIEKLGCDYFYLCLNKELIEDLQYAGGDEPQGGFHDRHLVDGYPDIMSVALAYENGSYVSYEDFPSRQMWPWQQEKAGESCTYLFSPLHFRDRCFGYTVIGNCEFALTSPLFRTWLINLSNSLESLRKQAKLQCLLERLDKMYVTDSLTGLYNRFGFARYTGDSFRECVQEGRRFMIFFADMDGLKGINDRYGHDKGDIAIKTVADALKGASTRQEVCARFGGDEYVVYAAGYTQEDASAFCKRFETLLLQYNETLGQPFPINASYGYEIIVPGEGDIIDKYIDRADNRMYQQKKEKKRRSCAD